MTNLEGQTFAGYEILSKLGEGGMGSVWKARQPMLNRLVALKMMSPSLSGDPAFVARFIREASAAANLNHPNMVQVYTAGENDKIYYIAMEFVEGESLRVRLDRMGRIPPQEAIAITVYVAQALQYAWNKAHLIHRDIKPDNIFLSNSGEVKVGDLGLAKSVGGETTDMTQTGMVMGSPHYISPEQAQGAKDIDFHADIYSLGCTLYHMLTGKTPYQGDSSMAIMMKHINEPAPAIFRTWPACPMPLGRLVGKMVAKRRQERHQSYEDLVADLMQIHEKLRQSESIAPVATTPAPAVSDTVPKAKATDAGVTTQAKAGNRTPIYAAAGVCAAVALAGLLWWSPWKGGEEPRGKGQAVSGSESRLQAESGERQPAKAGTPTAAPTEPPRQETVALITSPTPAPPPAAVAQLAPAADSAIRVPQSAIPAAAAPFDAAQARQHQEAWARHLGVPLEMTNSVGMKFVLIPPGRFLMGSPEGEGGHIANEAQHEVTISKPFYMGVYPVTVSQFAAFVEDSGYKTDAEKEGWSPGIGIKDGKILTRRLRNDKLVVDGPKVSGASWRQPSIEQKSDHPVIHVSWNDASAFCNWLSKKLGRPVALPTEAQWEYACRAGTKTAWPWGDNSDEGKGWVNCADQSLKRMLPDGVDVTFFNWDDGFAFTSPVGSFKANAFGLFDMIGNAAYWCRDHYGDYERGSATDPTGAGAGTHRVVRGGSWNNFQIRNCRSAARYHFAPSHRNERYGFRVVAEETSSASSAAATRESGMQAPAEARVIPTDFRRGLALHFSFDADTGNKVTDSSGLNNHGTAVGAKWTADGKNGGGFVFGRDRHYIAVTNSPSLNPPQLTASAWIKTAHSEKVWLRIFDKCFTNGYAMSVAGIGTARSWQGQAWWEAGVFDKPKAWIASGSRIDDGRWHHIVGTAANPELRLYVDGVPVGNPRQAAVGSNTCDLTIGLGRSTPVEPFPGLPVHTVSFSGIMDDIMLFDRALSAEEVKALYELQNGRIIAATGAPPSPPATAAVAQNAAPDSQPPVSPAPTPIAPASVTPVQPADEFKSLFNGKDLTGWKVREGNRPDSWVVRDGALVNTEPKVYLVSEETFGDFEFHCEFRLNEKGDGGVYLRGLYQIQLLPEIGKSPSAGGSGAIHELIAPSENAAKGADEWQTLDAKLVGKKVAVTLNGRRVIEDGEVARATRFSLNVALDAPGPIMLQGHLGTCEYRNIRIKPLRAVSAGVAPQLTLADNAFAKEVAVLPPAQQVARVMAKLKELNPNFDGKQTHKVEGGAVTELAISTMGVTNISPVSALKQLKKLTVAPWVANQKGALADLSPLRELPLAWLYCQNNPISDLSPLKGLPLTVLSCGGTQVTELSPLAGMKLTVLSIDGTAVSDISPLSGMPLTVLWCNNTWVADFASLKGLPLQELRCDFQPQRDTDALRGIPTLRKINDQPAAVLLRQPATSAQTPRTAAPSDDIRVLIVTGVDSPAHDWRSTGPAIRNELQKDPRMKVEILNDIYRLDSMDLAKFQVVLLNFYTKGKPDPNEQAKDNLKNFVNRGGGLVIFHSTCGSFRDWPEFRDLAGKIMSHEKPAMDMVGPMRVKIVNQNHPITRGMKPYETTDELYAFLTGRKPVEILATAHAKCTGSDEPMAFVLTYGKGRVFHIVLGHTVGAIETPGTAELLRRGTSWVAGREPVPSTATQRPLR